MKTQNSVISFLLLMKNEKGGAFALLSKTVLNCKVAQSSRHYFLRFRAQMGGGDDGYSLL